MVHADTKLLQHFTRPRTPKTNGKAERVIRTLMEGWHRKRRFASREERRRSLYAFADHFNHERKHGALGNRTPIERLQEYSKKQVEGGNNA